MSDKTLGGCSFAYNAIQQDYNILETLECLYELCDQVSVVVGGTDGTIERVKLWASLKLDGKPIFVTHITEEEWHEQVGRDKLSYFSNIAIGMVFTDYIIYVQADEVLHESSFPYVRQAIETGAPSFMITRHNLWATPYNRLEVDQSRKPCSTEVIRLAKKGYYCVGDAESLGVDQCDMSFVNKIVCYHMGFVRDKYKHLVKIDHMQSKVFLWETDKRIHDNKDGFNCWKWGFTPADVVPIEDPLPKYIKEWAEERVVPVFQEEDFDLAVEWMRSLNLHADIPGYEKSEMLKFINNLWMNMSMHYQKITPGTSSEPGV